MKSFRIVIRRSTAVLVAALVLVFSVLVYWGVQSVLKEYIDARLLAMAETLASLIESRPDFAMRLDEELVLNAEGLHIEEERRQLREAAYSVQLFSADGRLVWRGSEAKSRSALTVRELERLRSGHVIYDTLSLPEGSAIRRLSIPMPRSGDMRYILGVEASLLFAEKALSGLMLLLVVVGGGVIAIAWVSSGWLAQKIATPVEVLSATAETISGTEHWVRFAADAPYEEFQQLVRAFNAMLSRLVKAAENQRRFVDYAAHEMQTPLSVLQANLEVTLHKARTADEYRESLINNLEQVERLVTFTRELLMLTRLGSDNPPVRLVPLDMEPLLKELMDELAVLADDRGIKLSSEIQPVSRVLGDAQWLKHVMINLLDNVLRYTGSGGTVLLRLHQVGDEVIVAVQDTGAGIEPHHLPHLFERFYRTDAARARDAGGTGLGLPIVKEIADAHRGTIKVESQVGKGSVFTIILPAVPM